MDDPRATLEPRPAPEPAPRVGRWLVGLLTAAFVAAGATVLVVLGGHITPSSDPGTPTTHVAWGWLAVALLVAVCALTSRGLSSPPVRPGPRLGIDLAVLVACAIAFPAVMRLPVWQPEDYVLVKVVLLLAVPALALWLLHRRVGPGAVADRPPLRVLAVVGAVAAIAAHQAITQFGPGAAAVDFSRYDLTTLVVAATATVLTASIGEEIFYRYWLQTRFEALWGRWPAIVLASAIFGLMHLASHTAGHGFGIGVAIVIANQGVFGIACGYLWSRYRRLWLPILLHLSTNGLLVVIHLAGHA